MAKPRTADEANHGRSKGTGRKWSRQASEPADWGSVDPTVLAAVIIAVTRVGGAVRFGYTSDGGAYAIGLYGDGDPHTEYVRPSEDIGAALQELVIAWGGE